MPRTETWTSVSITQNQYDVIEKIHVKTRLKKNDIVELALMKKYPQYFQE